MGLFKAIGGVTPFKQTETYEYYLMNDEGKRIPKSEMTIEEYWMYENQPGTDLPTKVTNNPDVYGRECGGSPSDPKVCGEEEKPE